MSKFDSASNAYSSLEDELIAEFMFASVQPCSQYSNFHWILPKYTKNEVSDIVDFFRKYPSSYFENRNWTMDHEP